MQPQEKAKKQVEDALNNFRRTQISQAKEELGVFYEEYTVLIKVFE